MSQDYYSVLAQTIAAVGHDRSQLRLMIYQYVRSELRKELYQRKNIRWFEVKQQISALEKAIEQIELDIIDNSKLLSFPLNERAAARSASTALVVHRNPIELAPPNTGDRDVLPPIVYTPPYPAEHDWRFSPTAEPRVDPIQRVKPIRKAFWSTFQLMIAAILGVALYSAAQRNGDLLGLIARYWRDAAIEGQRVTDGDAGQSAASAVRRQNAPVGDKQAALQLAPDVPIPTTYGVFSVNQGKLSDLQSLPIKVPDQRVAISALISTPSETALPDGRLQFIVFRRDLAINAPDQVTVRVVARVMRALTFDAKGKPKTIDVEGSWAVRGYAYGMKVAPVIGNPEMIFIRPEDPNFLFPAGRYALMLKGLAYDFSVAGSITDIAQCLERTDAISAPVYTECRGP